MRRLLPLLAISLLAACAGVPKKPPAAAPGERGAAVADAGPAPDCSDFKPYPKAQEDPSTRGDYVAGGLYRPGVSDSTPDYIPNVACIAEPEVVHEPRSAYGNRSPYTVLGKSFHVLDSSDGFVETGLASYYGNKFHGRRTSNHEIYDMYAFTAAHKSLPLPSFARVTNLENGQSVIVRVNDRGPFHDGRVVDLSYAAAVKLGIHRRGTGRVEVRALKPGDAGAVAASPPAPAPAPAATAMDALVDGLAQSAPAVAAAATPSPDRPAPAAGGAGAGHSSRLADHPEYGREEDRFRMVDANGRVRSADEFDAWLRERQARIDAAKAAQVAQLVQAVQAAPAPAAAVARVPAPVPDPAVAPSSAPPAAPAAAAAAASADGVTLQVGVFSVRGNAERALAALRAAGIQGARLQDVADANRTLWRVRVGPVANAAVAELSSRVSGLGLGVPQIVRE